MAFYFNEINLVIGIMGAALKVTGKSSEIKSAPVVSGALISGICMLLIWVLVEAASIGQVRKINAKSIASLTRHRRKEGQGLPIRQLSPQLGPHRLLFSLLLDACNFGLYRVNHFICDLHLVFLETERHHEGKPA